MSEGVIGSSKVQALRLAYLKVEELEKRLMRAEAARSEASKSEPIAIVGMACRFPEATGLEDYWQLLREARDAITEIPPERWDLEQYYDADPATPGKMYTRWGGFLADVDQFDPQFFGISPRETISMDPQQRLLLETSWQALEHAAIAPDSLAGSKTGCFIGVGFNEYARLLARLDSSKIDAYSGSGNQLCFCAGRLSYVYGLSGPSLPIDTACSSSLVAIHQACRSLRGGESRLALAGGVNLLLAPEGNIFLSKAGALSPDGRCKTFDAAANGFVRGEGCGVLVLKRLGDARADGDRIWALIRGSSVNHDGRSSGLTVPSGPAQEAVMRAALEDARLEPAAIDYVEAHGTGTALGDPIEMQALAGVFGARDGGARPLIVGSVKTNFGHLEAASGVASVIKVILMLQHQALVPQVHFKELSPHIKLGDASIEVAVQETAWRESAERPRLAGVSSFGLSGTNAHLVLEEPPALEAPAPVIDQPGPWLLPISAHKSEALRQLASAYVERLSPSKKRHSASDSSERERFATICRTAAVGRKHHDHRLAILATSASQATELLSRFGRGQAGRDVMSGHRPLTGAAKLAFVFSGQGAQRPGMGLSLLQHEPIFRREIQTCDGLLRELAGWSLFEELGRPEETSRLQDTEIAQPAILALQLSLAALWRSWGVHPHVVIGHSMGEVTAACVAGILNREQAMRLIIRRGRLMQRATGLGTMAAVGLSRQAALAAIEPHRDVLAVAAHNGPASTVLSGEREALVSVLEALKERKVFCRELAVDYAFHSPQTADFGAELAAEIQDLTPSVGEIQLVSTVTGAFCAGPDLDADHWGRNVTQPVVFADAVGVAIDLGCTGFVEIGPHPVLAAGLGQTFDERGSEHVVVPTLRHDKSPSETLCRSLGKLYCAGVDVDWRSRDPAGDTVADLPPYPWQRQRFWVDLEGTERAGDAQSFRHAGPAHSVLGYALVDRCRRIDLGTGSDVGTDVVNDSDIWVWEQELNGESENGDRTALSFAHCVEIASAAAREATGRDVALTELEMHEPLTPGGAILQVSVLGTEAGLHLRVHSRGLCAPDSESWKLNASATLERAG